MAAQRQSERSPCDAHRREWCAGWRRRERPVRVGTDLRKGEPGGCVNPRIIAGLGQAGSRRSRPFASGIPLRVGKLNGSGVALANSLECVEPDGESGEAQSAPHGLFHHCRRERDSADKSV